MVQIGLGEACREWENALKAGPPRHEAWYGYAELCLYPAVSVNTSAPVTNSSNGSSRAPTRRSASEPAGLVCSESSGPKTRRASRRLSRSRGQCRPDALSGLGSSLLSPRTGARATPSRRFRRRRFSRFKGTSCEFTGPFRICCCRWPTGVPDGRTRPSAVSRRPCAVYDWRPSRVDSLDAWLYHTLRERPSR